MAAFSSNASPVADYPPAEHLHSTVLPGHLSVIPPEAEPLVLTASAVQKIQSGDEVGTDNGTIKTFLASWKSNLGGGNVQTPVTVRLRSDTGTPPLKTFMTPDHMERQDAPLLPPASDLKTLPLPDRDMGPAVAKCLLTQRRTTAFIVPGEAAADMEGARFYNHCKAYAKRVHHSPESGPDRVVIQSKPQLTSEEVGWRLRLLKYVRVLEWVKAGRPNAAKS